MGVMKQIEEAREFLKSKGYYVDNLWTIDDVQEHYECTDEEAMGILHKVLQNGWYMERVFEMINNQAEEDNLKRKEQ